MNEIAVALWLVWGACSEPTDALSLVQRLEGADVAVPTRCGSAAPEYFSPVTRRPGVLVTGPHRTESGAAVYVFRQWLGAGWLWVLASSVQEIDR